MPTELWSQGSGGALTGSQGVLEEDDEGKLIAACPHLEVAMGESKFLAWWTQGLWSPLPIAGLLASPVVVRVEGGTASIPIVKVGFSDVLLYSKTVVGALSGVCVVSLPTGVEGMPPYIAIMASQVVAPTVSDQVGLVDLSGFSEEEQREGQSLLHKYASVSSSNVSDLGFTNPISHEIPLLDPAALSAYISIGIQSC